MPVIGYFLGYTFKDLVTQIDHWIAFILLSIIGLKMIKESFNKTVTTESEIMELYSNVDMLIIDDFGSETISKWALEKLYRIINNRYENELPIVITTRYTREELMEKIAIENRKLAEEFIQILYKMCYGISLIKNDRNAKEKASKSDKTKC